MGFNKGKQMLLLLACLLVSVTRLVAQDTPKLVVLVVVDQMRYDYIDRFWEQYGNNGFKRLQNEGFNFRNTHYNYVPTRTAPGHASLVTGTTPARHGITSNNWYDKVNKVAVYPIHDATVSEVSNTGSSGKSVSAHRVLASTIGDEMKLALHNKAKVIGMGIKDRAAVLMAGHLADGAYWFSGNQLVSSTYYMKTLPTWVVAFNEQDLGWEYMRQGWDLLKDRNQYPAYRTDKRAFERGILNGQNSFPYRFTKAEAGSIGATPYGNSLLTDFALACITEEKLGQSDRTDFLAIGYSATDYIGHRYGAGSLEIMDTYLRLDQDIARLLGHLDAQVGKGKYTLVLSADHAGMHNATYLDQLRYHSGFTYKKELSKDLNGFLKARFGVGNLVMRLRDEQVYLDFETAQTTRVESQTLTEAVIDWLESQPGIRAAYAQKELLRGTYRPGSIRDMLQRGIHPDRTGDVFFLHEPGWQSQYLTANHGTPYTQDTHVPNLWFGAGVPQGQSVGRKSITDIAPTLSMWLRVPLPNAADGNPLSELFQSE